MKITYNSDKEFYDGVYELTTRGLMFTATVSTLTITLTGGY